MTNEQYDISILFPITNWSLLLITALALARLVSWAATSLLTDRSLPRTTWAPRTVAGTPAGLPGAGGGGSSPGGFLLLS